MLYREVAEFRVQLQALIPAFFNPIAAIHHYRSIAEGSFNDNFMDGRIRIKKLFYVLRPLLACRWIEKSQAQPPTEFSALVSAEWVSADERRWIAELLRTKQDAAEAYQIELEASRANDVRRELAYYESASDLVPGPSKGAVDQLDRVLREWT